MRVVRPVLALAALSCLVGGVSAHAAAKPVCKLVTDASGDATGFVLTGLPLPNDANLDILSADIATGKKKVTAVIRLASLGKDSTSVSDTYYFNFQVGDAKYYMDAVYDGSASSFQAGDFDSKTGNRNDLGDIDGKIDTKAKTVTMTAPLSTWGISPTAKLSDFDVLGQRFIGNNLVGGATPTADEATSAKTYKGGTPSCVGPVR
jgi:hypothetical protein